MKRKRASKRDANAPLTRTETGAVVHFIGEARSALRHKGSPAYARRIQMFFRYPVRAYGCRTAFVRKLAADIRWGIKQDYDERVLLAVAEKLFAGPMVEERIIAVALLEGSVKRLGEPEFRRLERWIGWVGDWASCDGLCTALLGPLIIADKRRLARVAHWAKTEGRWWRRAAAVSLVPGARRGLFTREVLRLSTRLLQDQDDMVQKGVGWLLKETSKKKQKEVVAYLKRVRRRAPRLTLRIACEKLPLTQRRRILG